MGFDTSLIFDNIQCNDGTHANGPKLSRISTKFTTVRSFLHLVKKAIGTDGSFTESDITILI
jgi:hypothetical protein